MLYNTLTDIFCPLPEPVYIPVNNITNDSTIGQFYEIYFYSTLGFMSLGIIKYASSYLLNFNKDNIIKGLTYIQSYKSDDSDVDRDVDTGDADEEDIVDLDTIN